MQITLVKWEHFNNRMSDRAEDHIPVLLQKAVDILDIKEKNIVFDGTLGLGGHAREICKKLGRDGKYIGTDLDRNSLLETKKRLQRPKGNELFLIEQNYKNISDVLNSIDIKKVNKIILDLGWNTNQSNSGRGFSFNNEEELLMTYSLDTTKYIFTAKNIVNDWGEENIADIIYNYADETNSRKIAKAIVDYRKNKKIETSKELADIISAVIPRRNNIHPATKTFQALRIAVNDEIRSLKQGLPSLWRALDQGGIMLVITFHSIEDKIVKDFFKDKEDLREGVRYNKKAIMPTFEEIKANPRQRSAKLRAIIKN